MQMAQQIRLIQLAQQNPWQPPPTFIEESYNVNKELINKELREDEVQIKITGSSSLKAAKGDYVKYSLVYDGRNDFYNHFGVKENEKVFKHRFPSLDVIKGLRDQECIFSLKSQGWLGAKDIDK